MEAFTIGQLAKKANVNIETVRYYERRKLIPKAFRSKSGYRQYLQEDVIRIRFIRRAQDLGFSLKEILELLSMRVNSKTTCGDVKKQAETKTADIEKKIKSLQGMKRALKKLMESCSGDGPGSECPILEALGSEKKYTLF